MSRRASVAVAWGTLLAVALLTAGGSGKPGVPMAVLQYGNRPAVPATLFAFNFVNLEYGAIWPTVPFSACRNFHSTWLRLQPEPGRWTFTQLDADVERSEKAGVNQLLQLAYTPQWAAARKLDGFASEPSDSEAWRMYVRTVATRYKGRVRSYELWNEPNVGHSYSGSPEQLVDLNKIAYETLKAVDPAITVVSPAMSSCCKALSWLERYLAAGGGDYADVIGFHFYVAPRPPEAMLPLIAEVRAVLARYGQAGKPLWNTEMGWRFENRGVNPPGEDWAGPPLTDELASAFIARSYVLSWAAGVERLFWYAWGHNSMGLTEYGGKTPKASAAAFGTVRGWLVGSRIMATAVDARGNWRCELRRADGRPAWVVWQEKAASTWVLPAAWKVRKVTALDGRTWALATNGLRGGSKPSSSVRLGPSPILLEP